MGNFGKLKTFNDLPPDNTILEYIKEAATLNDEGSKVLSRSRLSVKKPMRVPGYFKKAIAKKKKL